MAVIARTAASLRFFGDDLNPAALTASLGRAPTASAVKGQEIVGENTGIVRIAKTSSWCLTADDRAPGDLDAQIQEIFGTLTTDLSVWRELAAKYNPDVFVGLFMERGNEGLDLSTETLGLLSSRCVSLDLDIYGPSPDD